MKKMYKRTTKDEYEIQGYYLYGMGWEVVTTEENRKDARRCLKEYNDNETEYPHRIIKKRVKPEEARLQ